MNYVKICLIIAMLLGGLYANCAFYPDDVGNDAGAGQYCGACCSTPGGDVVFPSGLEATCEKMGGTWNGAELCPDSDCNESNWQEYYPEMQYCYLQFANLSLANLSYANLAGAELSGSQLVQANLYEADLRGANLVQANLHTADLTGADLTGVNLSYANLAETSLYMADLSNTDCYATFFGGAYLAGTNFDGAMLTYAYFDNTGDCTEEFFCDGYDDASYDAGAASVDPGDMNDDGENNVQDVVLLVNDILNP